MTIAIGIMADEGLLLCADSEYTGNTKTEGQKIFTWFGPYAAVSFAFAGNVANARATIQECKFQLSEKAPLGAKGKKRVRLSIRQILEVVRAVVRYGIEAYVDRRPIPDREDAQFYLLVAIATGEEKPRLFYTEKAAVVEVEETSPIA